MDHMPAVLGLLATLPQTAAAEQDTAVVPVDHCAEVALDPSTAREAEALAALTSACAETGLAHRENWLAQFSAGRAAAGVDKLTVIREFGVAIRALRAAGRVVVAGELAWVA